MSRHRSRKIANTLIAISTSYQRENLLARGLGFEHLLELLLRVVRPLVRQGASLAYGGHWDEGDENFTYHLLRLISAEQEDNSLGGPDTNLNIGGLINHSAWPDYLKITPTIEARWINSCRIIRVTQEMAGLAETVPDVDAYNGSDRAVFNFAVTLSAMRAFVMQGMAIPVVESVTDSVPPAAARVLLGGKLQGYRGFLPGVFEEALLTLERRRPLYVLGGFGGAAETLARALLDTGGPPQEFTAEWHEQKNPEVKRLKKLAGDIGLPAGVRSTGEALKALFELIQAARADLPKALNTGLSLEETREMLTTWDVGRAVQLVRKGLESRVGLEALPA